MPGSRSIGFPNSLREAATGVVGSAASGLMARLLGVGDYTIRQNSLVDRGNPVPTFMNASDGFRFKHREFVGNIQGSTTFTQQYSLNLNPGLSSTFPFLATIASGFEEYEMHGLVWLYRPTSGSAVVSGNAALGVVVAATNYDALDSPFVSKIQMESYEYSNSVVPFNEMAHMVECAGRLDPMSSRRYVRTSLPPANADLRLYDMGVTTFATDGFQTAYTCGEIWVSYDVTLRKPRIDPNAGPTDFEAFMSHYVSSPPTSVVTGVPCGTNVLLRSGNPIPEVFLVQPFEASTPTWEFASPGIYCLVFTWNYGGTATATPTFDLGSNLSYLAPSILANNQGSSFGAYGANGFTQIMFIKVAAAYLPNVPGPNQLSVFNSPPGVNNAIFDLVIFPVAGNVS